jgi:beta-galactosidase
VLVTSLLHPVNAKGFIPRFGKTFKLDSSFSRVRWFGRQLESYEDMKEQSPVCLNERNVKEMTEPNIRPQESGNRCDTTFVEVSNASTLIRFDTVDKPFNLGVKPYSDLELTKMRHRSDEVTSGTYVTLSAFQQGIGTGSCGPYTLKEHCFKAKQDYELKFVISWKKLK